jgi:pseudouridine-5'-phosphate glycosidase
LLVTVPIPPAAALPANDLEASIAAALRTAQDKGITGSATTPFLLSWIADHTGGSSLTANIALLKNNAAVGAQIASALQRLHQEGS